MPNFAMYIKNPFLIAAIFVILRLVHGRTLPNDSSDNIEPKFNRENGPRNDDDVNRLDQPNFRRFNHPNTERISVGTYLSLIKFGTRKLIHPKKFRFFKKGYCFQKCVFLYKNHHSEELPGKPELIPMEHFSPDYHHFRSLNTDYRWPINNNIPPYGGYQPETYRPLAHHHHVGPPIISFPFNSDLHDSRLVHPMMYWHHNGYLPMPLL